MASNNASRENEAVSGLNLSLQLLPLEDRAYLPCLNNALR
jgi:hypothetical protein